MEIVEKSYSSEYNISQLRTKLKILEKQLAEKEMVLVTLEAQLVVFKRKYIQAVGIYLAELDRLEADIADKYLFLNPKKAEARYRAETARERASKSEEEARTTKPCESNKQRFHPSANMKSIYRDLCKRIHPDLSVDPDERARRTKLMAKVNKAFENGDDDILRAIYEDFQLKTIEINDFNHAEVYLLQRKIDQVLIRIHQIDIKIFELTHSDLYRLMEKVIKAEDEGNDLLGTMANEVQNKIKFRKQTLEELILKTKEYNK